MEGRVLSVMALFLVLLCMIPVNSKGHPSGECMGKGGLEDKTDHLNLFLIPTTFFKHKTIPAVVTNLRGSCHPAI